FPVEDNLEVVAPDGDLLLIPGSGGVQITALRGNDAVNRTVCLPRLDRRVDIGGIVEDLALDAVVGGRRGSFRHTNSDAVIAAFSELELESEHEVAELFAVVEILALFRSDEHVRGGFVAFDIAGP